MIKVSDIERIIKDMSVLNHDISVRDISFVILSREFDNDIVAYKAIFGKDSDRDIIEEYSSSKKISSLRTYIKSSFDKVENKPTPVKPKKEAVSKDKLSDITFEENKAAIIDLIKEIKELAAKGEIPAKDAKKMELDARTKLNDKFEVEKSEGQQYIIVEKKFNFICPHLHKECYIYTKEDLMEEYGLIEKP